MPAPDFPTAGIIYGAGRRARGLPHRPRPRGDARAHARRGHRQGRRGRRSSSTSCPTRCNKKALLEKIAELVREKRHRGHLRHPRRVRQVRHARGDRAEARRDPRGRAQQPLQADAAAGHLRHEHGGAGRRPAAAAQPEGSCSTRSSRTAARWSRAARCSSCARRASAATCWKASRWRCRTSTRSSRSSRRRRRPAEAQARADGARLALAARRGACSRAPPTARRGPRAWPRASACSPSGYQPVRRAGAGDPRDAAAAPHRPRAGQDPSPSTGR